MVNNNTNPDTMRKRINNITSANYGEEIEVLNTDVENIFENTAPEYDKTHTYNANDLVISEGKLYMAKQTATGDFDPTKWERTRLSEASSGFELKTKTYVGTGETTLVLTFETRPKFFMFTGYNDVDVALAVPLTPLPQVESEPHTYILNYNDSYASGVVTLTDAETNEYTFTGGDSGLALNGDGKTETIFYLD